MSISIKSDLVLDVMKAVSPQQRRLAELKLGYHANGATIEGAPELSSSAQNNQKFEAMMLRNFVGDMMPKAVSSLYGDGTAGEIWRSMQVDFMSEQIAKSGGIGIANMLNAHGQPSEEGQPGPDINRIRPRYNLPNDTISQTSEWPYFSTNGFESHRL